MAVEQKSNKSLGLGQQDRWPSSNDLLWGSQQSVKTENISSENKDMWSSEMNSLYSSNSGSKTNLNIDGTSDGSSKQSSNSESSQPQKGNVWGQNNNYSVSGEGGSNDTARGWSYSSNEPGSFGSNSWSNSIGAGGSSKTNEEDKLKMNQNNSGAWNQAGSTSDNSNLWTSREGQYDSALSNIWDKDTKLEPTTLWSNPAWENDSLQANSLAWESASGSELARSNDASGENRSLWNRPNAETKWTPSNNASTNNLFQESSWQQGSNSTASSAAAAAAAAGSAVNRPVSITQDELIAKYVNSHEGWGKTPIRQDTPWDLTEEVRPVPLPDANMRRQRSQSSSNGVAIWESSRTTSVSDGSTSDWDSDNEGMGHRWNRGGDGSQSRSSKDELTSGTTSGVWNDGNSSIKTETGIWEDTTSDNNSRLGNAFDATISTWEENTQDDMRASRGGGDGLDGKQIWPKDKSVWGEGNIGNWGDSGSGASQKVDDGTSSWGQTQQPKSDAWNENNAKQRASPDEWNAQQNWGSSQAALQKKLQQQPQMPNRSAGPMQMRSQMLQDLVRRGFKKEEAQEALIRHNMDFDNALAELSAIASGQRIGAGNDIMKGRKLLGANSDSGPESHMDPRMMPTMGIQQQSQLPSGNPYPNTAIPPPLPGFQGMQSNAALSNVPSMGSNMQQSKGNVYGSQPQAQGLNKPDVQGANGLQVQQQQLFQQLQMAVQQGQISPTMLAQYQQNPSQMVNIGNLAQLNSLLVRLMSEYQQVQSARPMNPLHQQQQQQQLEKLQLTIQQVKAQIKQQQLHITQAFQQQPSNIGKPNAIGLPSQNPAFPGMGGENKAFSRDLNSAMGAMGMMSMKDSSLVANQNVADSSQLSKWKIPSPEKEVPPNSGRFSSLGQANPIQLSSGSGMIPHVASTNDFGMKPAVVGGLPHNASAPDLQAQGIEGNQASLEIEEFVPGRRWQGLVKSADDDPYLTPGQVAGRISMNRINDDYVMNTLGKTQPSGSQSSTDLSGLGQIGSGLLKQQQQQQQQNMQAPGRGWNEQQQMQHAQQWTGGSGPPSNVRPGQMQQPGSQSGIGGQPNAQRQWNRNMPGVPGAPVGQQTSQGFGVPPRGITWLLLTNVGPQVDLNVLKAHGACKLEPLGKPGEILAGFTSRDNAIRAYSAIQQTNMNARGPKINVEVVPEANVQQLLLMMRGGIQWSPNIPPPMMGAAGMPGGMPWDEHTNQLLPGDLLGGVSLTPDPAWRKH